MILVAADADHVLLRACEIAGVDVAGAQRLRLAENAVYRLAGGVVARVGRPGQVAAAANEVRVARWLERAGLRAARVLPGIDQPVDVDGAAVTFWRELPAHHDGDSLQVAAVLRKLHRLPVPAEFMLPPLAPFVRVRDRISAAGTLSGSDRRWLLSYLADLESRYTELPDGLPHSVVHGDAWVGNVVVDSRGDVWLLDLERFSVGPPEWDLVSTAVRMTSFGTLDAAGHDEFCVAYGHDVTTWAGFETLRDIRELRACSYMLQHAASSADTRAEAAHRVACLRGLAGPRPWIWTRIV